MTVRGAIFLGLVICVTAPFAGHANGDENDEGALAASRLVREGKVLPLSVILEKQRTVIGDMILEVEFENEGGHWAYGIYFLGNDGRRHEVYVDAATGELQPGKSED